MSELTEIVAEREGPVGGPRGEVGGGGVGGGVEEPPGGAAHCVVGVRFCSGSDYQKRNGY